MSYQFHGYVQEYSGERSNYSLGENQPEGVPPSIEGRDVEQDPRTCIHCGRLIEAATNAGPSWRRDCFLQQSYIYNVLSNNPVRLQEVWQGEPVNPPTPDPLLEPLNMAVPS